MSTTETSAPGPAAAGGADLRERTEQTIAAFNAHDAAAFASCCSEDTVVEDAAAPELLRGRAAVQRDAERVLAGMPDAHLQLQEYLVDGAVTAIRVLVVGTHNGPMPMPTGEVPATGRRVETPMGIFSRHDEDGSSRGGGRGNGHACVWRCSGSVNGGKERPS
ncbi:nuclear transport factor 2 family protein [Kocuria aegyptia]